jgi:hypothetical protein
MLNSRRSGPAPTSRRSSRSVDSQYRLRRAREAPAHVERPDEWIDTRVEQRREGQRLDPREGEALVCEPVVLVARMASAQPQPRTELCDDRRRVVEVAVGGDEEGEDLGGRELVQPFVRP